ncbi:MAG: hypothetical protein KDD67_12125 [Ignavibacteriae bacterium]|nr:hypothetical protein [Ignavibacteriota bacterium]MCB9217239.1 hypothetical protein [Ignavibacteria bacterium]
MLSETERIDVLYKEYSRLHERLDELMDGSLNDFKLLGFVWPVITGTAAIVGQKGVTLFGPVDTGFLSFVIFMVMLLIIGIIAFRDFLKVSLINYQLYLIRSYESEISLLLDNQTRTFSNIKVWSEKFMTPHLRLYTFFTLITVVTIATVPTVILYLVNPSSYYWVVYLLSAIVVYVAHLLVALSLRREMTKLQTNYSPTSGK